MALEGSDRDHVILCGWLLSISEADRNTIQRVLVHSEAASGVFMMCLQDRWGGARKASTAKAAQETYIKNCGVVIQGIQKALQVARARLRHGTIYGEGWHSRFISYTFWTDIPSIDIPRENEAATAEYERYEEERVRAEEATERERRRQFIATHRAMLRAKITKNIEIEDAHRIVANRKRRNMGISRVDG